MRDERQALVAQECAEASSGPSGRSSRRLLSLAVAGGCAAALLLIAEAPARLLRPSQIGDGRGVATLRTFSALDGARKVLRSALGGGQAAQVRPEELGASLQAQASCLAFGCTGKYEPSRSCQCNHGCISHGSCCSDYHSVCAAALAADAEPSQAAAYQQAAAAPAQAAASHPAAALSQDAAAPSQAAVSYPAAVPSQAAGVPSQAAAYKQAGRAPIPAAAPQGGSFGASAQRPAASQAGWVPSSAATSRGGGQCPDLESCLKIVDDFLDDQPRSFGLLQVRSEASLEQDLPGPCPEGPAKCRHDSYDSALAALYYTKRGRLDKAQEILDALLKILYPDSLSGIAPNTDKTQYVGLASGNTLTLLASSYNSANAPRGGNYENPYVTDGGVDTGNNAWAALSFAHFAAASSKSCYGMVAEDIMGAIADAAGCSDSLQGFMGHLQPYPAHYRSTEHNIDMYGLGTVMGNRSIQSSARSFVQGMYGKSRGHSDTYATGTGDAKRCDGTVAPGYPIAVDATFWNILADADPSKSRIDSALKFALRTPGPGKRGHPDSYGLWVSDVDEYAPDGSRPTLSGLRFSTQGNGVQWENTAGAVMAMVHYLDLYGPDDFPRLPEYIESARGSIRTLLQLYQGVPSSVLGGTYTAWQTYSQGKAQDPPGGSDTGLGWPYLRYTATAPTAWAGLMLLHQFDENSDVDEGANPYAATAEVPTQTDQSCLR